MMKNAFEVLANWCEFFEYHEYENTSMDELIRCPFVAEGFRRLFDNVLSENAESFLF